MTAVTATAQTDSVEEDTGDVTGTVSTEGGYEIPDADVRLVDAVSDTVERKTVSDSDGSYSFESVETGTYRVEAEFKGGEGESSNVTVEAGETGSRDVELRPQEEFFSVSVQGTTSPVTEGEEARVDITVTNAGEEFGSQAVVLDVPGIAEDADAAPVNPNSGSSVAISLGTPTDIGDAGEYTAEIRTNDDTEEVEIVVEERETDMEVSISGTNSPVTEGETLTVEARVSNPSEVTGRGTLTAEVDGLGSDTATFSLEGGAGETKSFEIQTESGDSSEYTVTVSVGDASDSMDVTVKEDTEADEDGGGESGDGEGEDDETETDDGSEDEVTDDDSETDTNESAGDADSGSGTETDGSDGSDASGGDGEDTQETPQFVTREVLRYAGIGAAVLVGLVVLAALSVLAVRKLRQRDWSGGKSDGEDEKPRVVLDTDSENEVYNSWSRMIERAGVKDIRTKTPSEIAESAKEAGLDPGAVDELTDVFEEVRYRDSEPTAEQERRAREAFERIKRSDRKE
jgi:hypothetical protein